MFKNYLLRSIIFLVGVLLIALGIALNSKHNLGMGPFDQFNSVLSDVLRISFDWTIIIVNLILALLYFVKHKNKDVWITLIAAFTLGTMVGVFIDPVLSNVNFKGLNYFTKIGLFLMAINLISIGVVIVLKSQIGVLAFEQGIILVNDLRPFRKLNFGQARMITDASLILLAIILSLIFLEGVVFRNYIATFATIILGGPIINVYLKLYDRLFLKNEKNL